MTASYVIAAIGTLSATQSPDFPGIDEFRGVSHHTARWPEHEPLAGRRVGVIGTGASGVKMIQTIASEVAHLTVFPVFQRTPTYCMPQGNRLLSDADRAQIERDWDAILASCRASYGGFIHDFAPQAGLAASPAEREAMFEILWNTPGFAFWLGNHGDLTMNDEVNEHACEFVRRKIRAAPPHRKLRCRRTAYREHCERAAREGYRGCTLD